MLQFRIYIISPSYMFFRDSSRYKMFFNWKNVAMPFQVSPQKRLPRGGGSFLLPISSQASNLQGHCRTSTKHTDQHLLTFGRLFVLHNFLGSCFFLNILLICGQPVSLYINHVFVKDRWTGARCFSPAAKTYSFSSHSTTTAQGIWGLWRGWSKISESGRDGHT